MRPDDFAGQRLFKLVHRTGNALAELLQAKCAAPGIFSAVTPSQWIALAWLDEHNGIPIGTLSRYLYVEASVTTGIVQRLEQYGFLERVHDCEDRRVVRVFLTTSGRNLVHSLEPVVTTFYEWLFHGFSSDEQRAFLAQLQSLSSNLPTSSRDHLDPCSR